MCTLRENALRPGANCASIKRGRRPAIISSGSRRRHAVVNVCARYDGPGRGGFYSAEDADSLPPEETASRASAQEIEGPSTCGPRADGVDALLGEDATIVRGRFGIEAGGNAPSDPQQEFTGKNLLYIWRIDRRVGHGNREASIDDRGWPTPSTRPLDDVRAPRRTGRGPPRRQGPDGVERADDRGLRADGACAASAAMDGRETRPEVSQAGAPRAAASGRYVPARAHVERGHADLAAALSRGPRRHRRVRGGLRRPHLRPARTVSGRRGSRVARVGGGAAAPAGRTVLGRGGRPAGSARPAATPASCCG